MNALTREQIEYLRDVAVYDGPNVRNGISRLCDMALSALPVEGMAEGVGAVTPSEALFAFAGWLTGRDESVTLGATHNAAIAAELVDAFNKSQGFAEPRRNWTDNLKPYPKADALSRQTESAAHPSPSVAPADSESGSAVGGASADTAPGIPEWQCVMEQWDAWRKYIANGGKASWPRDEFESLIDEFVGNIHLLRTRLAAVKRELDNWRNAVIDNLVNCCIYIKAHDSDPRKAINDLISYEVLLALDPRVSSDAQALIDKGRDSALAAKEPK